MKVVSPKQMNFIESQAYRDGALEEDFMEEAGRGVCRSVHELAERLDLPKHVVLLCGKGNNAGDAYVAGVHLMQMGYSVFALQLFPISQSSPLCQRNHRRFLDTGGFVREISLPEEMALPLEGVIVDGIFGTGFKGSVEEPIASFINIVNHSKLPILSVDIPSGLNGETGKCEGAAIRATATAFLGLPKTGFFLNDGWNLVGDLHYIDFGLPQESIDQADADLLMVTPNMARNLLPPIKRSRHKYEAGVVVGLAGSPTMPGAAVLATEAALRGGAGLVRLLIAEGAETALSSLLPEIIRIPFKYGASNKIDEELVTTLNKASAAFIGPGLGRTEEVRTLLRNLLPRLEVPVVLDADALTVIAEEKIALPQNAILTPHMGEMCRLLQSGKMSRVDQEFLGRCRHYVEEHGVTLVLKGGPSFIFYPGETPYVCPAGDPGMATAGSGDVLTGLLAALLAQGLHPHEAALLGVYLHGLAGEYAAKEKSSYCMIASDIIQHFPDAFRL